MKKIFWPHYELDGNPKFEIGRITEFMNEMGNPQDTLLPPIFHVAGTNGKGSTTAYIKYILEAEGYLVHRFTSPHLVDWNERIEVSSKAITDDYANELALECKNFAEKHNLKLSYFEGMTVMAFLAFMRNPAVATILEVGLGGRLDATNVIKNPLVEIITSISFDHMKTLGDTLSKIAYEKAGIIKEGKTLIIDKQKPEAFDTIYKVGQEKHNKIYACGKEWSTEKLKDSFIFRGFGKELELPLPYLQGDYQIDNAGGAIASLLAQDKIKISDKSIAEGLKNVRWIGRLQNMSDNKKLNQFLPKGTELIIDGAHNEDASRGLTQWLRNKNDGKYNILVIGMLQRKDSVDYINKLDKAFDEVITIKMRNEDKSKEPEEFRQEFLNAGWNNVIASGNFEDTLKYIGKNFSNGEKLRVVIAGSLYLMGEILEYARS